MQSSSGQPSPPSKGKNTTAGDSTQQYRLIRLLGKGVSCNAGHVCGVKPRRELASLATSKVKIGGGVVGWTLIRPSALLAHTHVRPSTGWHVTSVIGRRLGTINSFFDINLLLRQYSCPVHNHDQCVVQCLSSDESRDGKREEVERTLALLNNIHGG